MKKRIIFVVLFVLLSIGIISIYTTYAYNEEESKLEKSQADYNLIYSLKENSNREVIVNSKEEKYIDIVLKNIYESPVKYGMYYYLINRDVLPDGVIISLSEESVDLLENTIEPNQIRSVSIKIKNETDEQIDLIVGALVGFENGKIEDLAKNGEVLIK